MNKGGGMKKMKYVLVTGGVVSGLGKGVTASSIGVLLKACGLRVTSIKIGLLCSSAPSFLSISFSFQVYCYSLRENTATTSCASPLQPNLMFAA
jgi:hypothetical protein